MVSVFLWYFSIYVPPCSAQVFLPSAGQGVFVQAGTGGISHSQTIEHVTSSFETTFKSPPLAAHSAYWVSEHCKAETLHGRGSQLQVAVQLSLSITSL